MAQLPRLYKTTKTGAIQVCDISHTSNLVVTSFGQLDGITQVSTYECSPKNIGKANETTPEAQAILEAHAKWTNKVKSGYSVDMITPSLVQLPQKVKVYQDNLKNVRFPCYSTAKLNGVNGTYWLQSDDSLKLTSRGGDEYPSIPHLESEVHAYMKRLRTTCLNGELYIHGQHLQDITSAVKKPKPLSSQLEFSIFETPLLTGTYAEHRKLLVAAEDSLPELIYVSTLTGLECLSTDDIESHYHQCTKLGLEGTVIYNADAHYKFNERSSNVFKYKTAQDAEFKVLDYELDKRGHPTLICTTGNTAFKVRPKGTVKERTNILEYFHSLYKDHWYKVEFETLSKDGIPLKPVGIGLRDCDTNGNPTE